MTRVGCVRHLLPVSARVSLPKGLLTGQPIQCSGFQFAQKIELRRAGHEDVVIGAPIDIQFAAGQGNAHLTTRELLA